VLLFALYAGIAFALILSPVCRPFTDVLTRSTAEFSAAIIRLAGGHVDVSNQTLTAPQNGFSIAVVNGCNGINALLLLWAAQLAWPLAGWLEKLKRMGIGTAAILAANTFRIITLFYVGQWNRDWFEWMHLYVWEILIMLVGLAVFAAGARQTPTPAAAGAAK